MEKKLRIQLFDDEGRLVEDRMVSQDPEMYSGPKKQWSGAIRTEFTLESKEDIDKIKRYLDILCGILPMDSIKQKKLKILSEPDTPEQREELLDNMLNNSKDQDQLITNLREEGFVFVMSDFLKSFDFPGLKIKESHLEKYQWMIKCTRMAKNPKADKYDPMLIFGIQLLPEHNEKIVVYLNGELLKRYTVSVPDKPKNVFKKTNMVKFPHYMTIEERERFRFEIRQVIDNPDKKLSKFFTRWRPYVENIPQLPQDKKDEE